MQGITEKAAGFVANCTLEDMPPAARIAARLGFLDCYGVMLAGAREPARQILSQVVPPSGRNESVPVAGSDLRYEAGDAALLNGVAGHVLDFDDVALAGHPSAVLVPAILAAGYGPGASGREAIAAYGVGYELWAHLDALEPGHLHDRGFHPTAVMGTLAATAAVARLERLAPDQVAQAIAIAASLAAGLVSSFGSMTKSLHAGRAAQAAILAVRLATAGYTGSTDILEHTTGFLRAFSPSGRPELDAEAFRIGEEWLLARHGVNIKRYPTCYATHRAIDAMIALSERHELEAGEIAAITVETGATQALMLRNPLPQTGLEAKFSMEFAMASAVVAGAVGLRELTDDFVLRDDIQSLCPRVRVVTTDAQGGSDLPFAPFDLVRVELRDGRSLAHEPVVHPKGSWQLPMERDELRAKFLDCAGRLLGEESSAALFDQLYDLEELPDLRDLRLN